MNTANLAISGRRVYFKGRLIPESEARVSIYDSALMFGDVAFEMIRSFRGRHFRLRQHLERLIASARWLDLPIEHSIDQLEAICHEVSAANQALLAPGDEHRLMIDLTRGLLGSYADSADIEPGPNLIVADYPLSLTVAGTGHYYREGVEIFIPSQRTIPASLLDPKAKNRSRVHYLKAQMEANHYKGKNPWPLLLDPDGFAAEGTGSNFFLVKAGRVFTPEPRNILRGVSRAYTMELAGELGIPVQEANLEPYDIMMADEAFFTTTSLCLVPAMRLLGRPIGDGKRGPVFERLMTRWCEKVGVDIMGQIEGFEAAREKRSTAA